MCWVRMWGKKLNWWMVVIVGREVGKCGVRIVGEWIEGGWRRFGMELMEELGKLVWSVGLGNWRGVRRRGGMWRWGGLGGREGWGEKVWMLDWVVIGVVWCWVRRVKVWVGRVEMEYMSVWSWKVGWEVWEEVKMKWWMVVRVWGDDGVRWE